MIDEVNRVRRIPQGIPMFTIVINFTNKAGVNGGYKNGNRAAKDYPGKTS
jgi:hypothetical protein